MPGEPPRRCKCNEDSAGLATWVARPAESFLVALSSLRIPDTLFSKRRLAESCAAQNQTFLSCANPPGRDRARLAFKPSLSHRSAKTNLNILSVEDLLAAPSAQPQLRLNRPCIPPQQLNSILTSCCSAFALPSQPNAPPFLPCLLRRISAFC